MRKFLVLSAVALLLSTGCVSAAKYDLVQKDLDERTKERDSLTEKSDMLSKQMMAQAVEIDNLKKENQDLQNKVNELSPKAERAEQLEKATQTYQDLAKKLEKEIQEGQIEITEMKNRLTVTMVDKIIFPSGSAQISKEGKKVLNKVIDILKDVKDKRIQVEGHTDNVPIVSSLKKRFPTNWELSTGRATEVVRYLQEAGGLDAKLLSATGYSEYQPVASNESETGKRKNRRIEIVLLPLLK
jgi:chemotaxis protein MotB